MLLVRQDESCALLHLLHSHTSAKSPATVDFQLRRSRQGMGSAMFHVPRANAPSLAPLYNSPYERTAMNRVFTELSKKWYENALKIPRR